MSFLEELKLQRRKLKTCDTVVTTVSGERFVEKLSTNKLKKLNIAPTYGFVVDTKPDLIPAEILPNFLYLGSQDAVTLDNIKKYQLTCILSIGVECPLHDLPRNIKLLHIACLDLPETALEKDGIFAKCFDFIEMARLHNGSILIHCNAGVSRSASIVIAYLMQFKNMDFEIAYKHVKTQRGCIQPNAGFLNQLKNFRKYI